MAVFVVLPQMFVDIIKTTLNISDDSKDTNAQKAISEVSVFLIVTCFMVPLLKTCLTLFNDIAAIDFSSDWAGRAWDIWWAANLRPWQDLAHCGEALGYIKNTFSVADVTAMLAV